MVPTQEEAAARTRSVRRGMRMLLIFWAAIIVLGIATSGLRTTKSGSPMVLHPVAETRAVGYANAAAKLTNGVATAKGVLKVANAQLGVAVVVNLGHASGWPREVQYQMHSGGNWVKVCVVAPKDHSSAYPVVCVGTS